LTPQPIACSALGIHGREGAGEILAEAVLAMEMGGATVEDSR